MSSKSGSKSKKSKKVFRKSELNRMRLGEDSEELLMKLLLWIEESKFNGSRTDICDEDSIQRSLAAIDVTSAEASQRINKIIRDERFSSRQAQQ